MRTLEYLSPSSIKTWLEDKREFYLKYLAEDRPDRLPQTQPMSIGSAFDACVKNYLQVQLLGMPDNFLTLFESQVEEANREFAMPHGIRCFDIYRTSGALGDLMDILLRNPTACRFEFDATGSVYTEGSLIKFGAAASTPAKLVLMGKPDAIFKLDEHVDLILDWKVNGYMSKSGVSPSKGYVQCRDASGDGKGPHKETFLETEYGIPYDANFEMWEVNPDWGRQLCIYGWLTGIPVGTAFIAGIDQLVCRPSGIRVAEYRNIIGSAYQQRLYNLCCEIWEITHSQHIFRELTLAESQAKCAILDATARALRGDGSDNSKWFNSITRGSY